jgi:hypothetical protein
MGKRGVSVMSSGNGSVSPVLVYLHPQDQLKWHNDGKLLVENLQLINILNRSDGRME